MIRHWPCITLLLMLFVCCPAAQSQSCTPAPTGPVGWWPADGNAKDVIGGHNGTLMGGATFAAGEVGQAFSLGGSAYVDVPDSPSLNPTSAITVEAWVRANAFGSFSPVLKKANGTASGYSLEMLLPTGPGPIGFWVNLAGSGWQSSGSTTTIATGTWYHVAGTYDGAHIVIYINGQAEHSTSASGSINAGTTDLHIGHAPTEPDRYWNGLVDEAAVYNRALSAAEILAIFRAGKSGKCKGLTFSPVSLKFPRRTVGTTSPPQAVTAKNAFAIPVTVSNVTTGGDFAQTNTCPAPPAKLAAGANCAVNVTFTPTAIGTRNGKLTITHSAPASPQSVNLTGAATDIALSPTSLNFGSHKVGTTSAAKTVTVTNAGSVTVHFTGSGIVLAGADPVDYVISANTCGTSLANGAHCTVSVEFKPTATGARSASLNFNDDGGSSPQTVALTGTGT